MKRLPVALDELAAALDEPRGGPVRVFFHRDSGALEHVPRDLEVEGVYDDLFATPTRWVELEPLPERKRLELRAHFVEEVADLPTRQKLREALGGAHPLADFARLLRRDPPLAGAWEAYRTEALDLVVRLWLATLGVEPAGGAPAAVPC